MFRTIQLFYSACLGLASIAMLPALEEEDWLEGSNVTTRIGTIISCFTLIELHYTWQ